MFMLGTVTCNVQELPFDHCANYWNGWLRNYIAESTVVCETMHIVVGVNAMAVDSTHVALVRDFRRCVWLLWV